jgi:bifunctional ADP-heptose synthase (sugar kinase/adenylyltransferase)
MNQLPKSLKILLLGDSCYDYYHYGEVKRISPEAPIPIFDHLFTHKKLGMMSNVLENFRALGVYPDYQTHFFENKNRYVDFKSKQQLLRVDQKINEDGIDHVILEAIKYDDYDAIVISDYNKSFIDYKHITEIRKRFEGPVFIDTKKKDLEKFGDCIVKINQHEYKTLISYPRPENLIVTHGGESVTWNDNLYFPPKVDAYDVCGAGDTFLAALVFEYLRKNNMEEAIRFAMKAAAVTVQKIGVYAPTLEEVDHDNNKT